MKRLALVAFVLSLAACQVAVPSSIPTAPAVIADRVVLDEQVGIGVEASYKLVRIAVELAVDSGQLKGQRAAQAQVLNRKLYAFTLATQSAYRAGNAASYRESARQALATAGQVIALVRSR